MRHLIWVLLIIFAWPSMAAVPFYPRPGFSGEDFNGIPCNSYAAAATRSDGKSFDYIDPYHRQIELPRVEIAHFTPQVEQLVKGKKGPLPQDIIYTVMRFPNHHRALYSMIRFDLKTERKPHDPWLPSECYVLRAMGFKPDDGKLYELYALVLHKKGKLDRAEEAYETAIEKNPDSAQVHYNAGLLYLSRGKKDKALEHAKAAYSMGFQLQGLKKKLKAAGRWEE